MFFSKTLMVLGAWVAQLVKRLPPRHPGSISSVFVLPLSRTFYFPSKGGHEVLSKRKCIRRHLVMQCKVWGRDCFLESQGKSQCFGEPVPLHCELSKSFPALSTPLGGTGLLEGARVGYFPSLGQLGSGESFS